MTPCCCICRNPSKNRAIWKATQLNSFEDCRCCDESQGFVSMVMGKCWAWDLWIRTIWSINRKSRILQWCCLVCSCRCAAVTPLLYRLSQERKGWLLSVRKFCFLTPDTVSKPQFPQSFQQFRASIALQRFISDIPSKCREMLWWQTSLK